MVVSSACMTTASTTHKVISTRKGDGGSGPDTSLMMACEQVCQRLRQATCRAGIDIDHGAHAMAQRGFAGSIVDMDPHRNALHNLGSLQNRIAVSLPALFEAAEKVLFYAYEFAQDKAVEQSDEY